MSITILVDTPELGVDEHEDSDGVQLHITDKRGNGIWLTEKQTQHLIKILNERSDKNGQL